jgi:hypothetical protein
MLNRDFLKQAQNYLRLSKVPEFVDDRYGFRPNRSTVFRWKTRGCNGKRLKTCRVGGAVVTSEAWLLEFFSDDAPEALTGSPGAVAFLISEGFE